MSDLIVTSEVIDEGAKQLKSILDELEHMDAMWAGGDIWGHKTVAGAMDDFIDSWWVKREKLQDALKDLQEKMEQSAETWNNTETELENSLKPE
jgi:flagellar biosynthesis chaperone FliJ